MSLTVQQVAAYAKISNNTVHKLIKTNKLQAVQQPSVQGSRGRWAITTAKADIKQIVAVHAPHSGWKKKGNGHAAPAAPPVFKPRDGGLHEVFAFAALEAPTRQYLLALADRFSAEELKILVTL